MLKTFLLFVAGMLVSFCVLPGPGVRAASTSAIPAQDNVRYVGSINCQSSMCHGGASPSRDQFTIWSRQDFHSRAYATLITARSSRMAESLGILSATESNRCTVCHAPYEAIPRPNLGSGVDVTEGVSCEQCHNAAETWLRGHTRPDWSYADRVHAGLRDLRSAYVRANTCVACHQVLDPAILKAGHPELIFELDGQDASEPRHWKEKADWFGPKAWLVGQAVALREICRQISSQDAVSSDLDAQRQALVWLLCEVRPVKTGAPAGEASAKISRHASPIAVAAWGDQLARYFSTLDWKPEICVQNLISLSATSGSFLDHGVPLAERELRAERLVLGLDRLFKSLHPQASAPGQAELSGLFAAVQNRDEFNPEAFSSLLSKFAEAVTAKK